MMVLPVNYRSGRRTYSSRTTRKISRSRAMLALSPPEAAVLMTANCAFYSSPPDLQVSSGVQRDQGEGSKEEEGVLGAPGRTPCQRRKMVVCRRVLLLIYNFNLLLVYDFN